MADLTNLGDFAGLGDVGALSQQQLTAAVVEQVKALTGVDITQPGMMEALQIAIDRDQCPKHFYHFARNAYWHAFGEEFIDGWHIAVTCYALQALWEGALYTLDGEPSDTLVINEPPGCGKSRLMSVLFPSWIWCRSPEAGLWFTSFGQALCDRDALDTRRLITSDWYRKRFWPDVMLLDDQNTKRRYDNNRGGWRLSASIEARTGFGEHPGLLGIDDPHDPEQGASESQRQVAIETWTSKFSTRGIVRGVKKFIGAQRLHEEDLSGYVLANEEGVAHLMIPMEFDPDRRCTLRMRYIDIDKPTVNGKEIVQESWSDPRQESGELMWPKGMDGKKVSKLKKRLRRAHAIAGQLQQQPTSPEGDMFQREWFLDVVDDVPDGCEAVRAWDKATTTGRRSDYTVGVLAVSDGKFIYIANVRRGKWKRKNREKIIQDVTQEDMDLYARYQVRLVSDVGAAGSDAAEVSAEDLSESTAVQVRIDKPAGKPGRKDNSEKGWSIWAELLSRGRVRIVRGAWNQPFMDEHMAAPFGAHDDQIDAASHAVRVLWRRMRKGKIRRNLLVVTPEEQTELAQRDAAEGKVVCQNCMMLGCDQCGWSGFVSLAHENDLQAIFDAACRSGDESELELGVRW